MPLFAIVYEPGPAWRPGKPITEQPLESHTSYQRELHRTGRTLVAGPFMDTASGGMAIVRADDEAAAREILANDPAVRDGVFVGHVRPYVAMARAETTANVEVVRRLFAAVEGRNAAADASALWALYEQAYDPEVTIHEAPSLPYGGDYHGRPGIAQHAFAFSATWDPLQADDERRLDARFFADEDLVLVLWRHRAHDPSTGERFEMPAVSVYRLRDRHIVESRMFHFDAAASRAFVDRVAGTTKPTRPG